MRQEEKSGQSASQSPNRRGSRKGILAEGGGRFGCPLSLASQRELLWREKAVCQGGSTLQGTQVSYPWRQMAFLGSSELHFHTSLEETAFCQEIQVPVLTI